jgi:GntR family transcriptional regulator
MTLRTQHDKPVYVRLRETIADAILAGKYGDGDPLPSVARSPPRSRPTR